MKTSTILAPLAVVLLTSTTFAQDTPPADETQSGQPAQTDQVPANTQTQAPADQSSEPAMDNQDASGDQTGADQNAGTADEVIKPAQSQSEMRGSWIIGATVNSSADETQTVGKIEDLLIDAGGQVTGAVLSVGGFLGIGAKSIAVDWDRLSIDYDGYKITTDLTKEEAEQAKAYEFRERTEPPAPVNNAAPADGMAPAPAPAIDGQAEPLPAPDGQTAPDNGQAPATDNSTPSN